jgi:arylsulfatase
LKIRFLLLLFERAFIACLASDGATPLLTAKPNIVFIVADDMGFSDAGCYGSEIQTPNLDQLAKNGLRFTHFYNTARCWSSRACLLTGYYAQEVRRDELPGIEGGANGKRPAWAALLPALLRPAGYRSYHSGKWHLDGPVLAGGFDHSYCINDFDRYFNPKAHTLDDQSLPSVKMNSGYYSTTAIAQYAIDMLADHQAKHGGRPFFLYLAFLSPHFPLQALPEDIALYEDRYRDGWDALRQKRYNRMKEMGLINCSLSKLDPGITPWWNLPEQELREKIGPGESCHAVPWNSLTDAQKAFQPVKMSLHAAMIHRMDTEIGRVIGQLKKMGVLDNTAIFFLSDNGASAEQIIRGDGHDRQAPAGSAGTFLSIGPGWSSAANTPFRLHKSWVHEGGISTPLIVQWPDGIAARGELRDNPGHLIDLVPTVLDMARARRPGIVNGKLVPPAPGKSLVPVFSRDGSVSHDYFWWFHDGNRAIRVGDWKLVADHKKPFELYDMSTDRSESHNLAAEHPDKVRELEAAWTQHMEEFRAVATKDMPPRQASQKKPKAEPDPD